MDNLKVLQIVGYKNSRKTTLIGKWIKELNKYPKEVAVIKHHGHSTGLAQPNSNTDTMKFFQAGAVSSIAVDNQTIQLHQQKKEWTLQQLIKLAAISEPDILFIEGYKNEAYEKVVIVKDIEEWETLQYLTNIVCVVVHGDLKLDQLCVLSIENTTQLNKWLLDWIGGDLLEII